ncbi:hypothetical protein RvY_03785 [Ramazzottius varieornatus]|uniref:Structural maintenance of chromosomes protein n=1 Tax=Ramazzottius varieornatus TaxID=947166 RepID=A0A1D1UPA4_RAMVA|nr:hypothetical protein RvY_03785 [Ramazzottius varieornatus]
MPTKLGHDVYLKLLEIENFKSYKGLVTVGPLQSFTAVVGPNGSGKSNFMDAISFVFGEQARSLRVKKLNELIHGSNVQDPASSKCSVTAVLSVKDDEIRFQRIVKVSGNDAVSDYKIDGTSVSYKKYLETLEEYNIVVKPRNFLVFQGQVEQIATMDPKQRTALFEKVSRSGEFKEEYDKLQKELEAANEEMRKSYSKKKEFAVEERDAKEDKKIADEYAKRQADLSKEKSMLQLFELYHKDTEIENIKKEVKKQRQQVEELERERAAADEKLKAAKKRMGEKAKEVAQLDQAGRAAELRVSNLKPEHIKMQTRIEHMDAKIESEKRMLKTLETTQKTLNEDIRKLELEMTEVQDAQQAFDDSQGTQAQDPQSVTQLSGEQLAEYHRLKNEASRQMTQSQAELDSLKREAKKDRENLASERSSYGEVSNDIKRRRTELEQLAARNQRIEALIQKSNEEKTTLTTQVDEIEASLEGNDENISRIQTRLGEISRKYAEARVDERELARKARKEDLVNKLKQLYGDEVLGRLIDLCHHSHERYQLAVTKVLGKYMNGIVVTSDEIAAKCIAYMKSQEIEPEQFIPLNSLDVKPIAEHLRRLDPENVKLVTDIITITYASDKAAVQKALKFACGSAVTCKDTNMARQLSNGREKLQVVTWSGTLFDKSGVISGGAAELRSRAKRWDEKEVGKLKAEQTKLAEELKAAILLKRKEVEVREMRSRVKGCEARIKHAEQERREIEKQTRETQQDLEKLETTEKLLSAKVKSAEEKVQKSDQKLKVVQTRMNNLEDDIFREFCAQLGVKNIRQYEAREISERQEREKRMLEFTTQINKLTEQINYQKSRLMNMQGKIDKCDESVRKLKKDVEAVRNEEKKKAEELRKAEEEVEKIKKQRDALTSSVDEKEGEVEEAKKDVQAATKALTSLTRKIATEEATRDQLKRDRKTILQYCKMNNVVLPMVKGSMEDIGVAVAALDSSATVTDTSQESLSQVAEDGEVILDYGKLPPRLKNMLEASDRQKETEKLSAEIRELENTLETMNTPKPNAGDRLTEIKNKAKESNKELDEIRAKVVRLGGEFDRVKRERYTRFTTCLDTVSTSIDLIYKELVNEESAQAFLNADNQENPYNGGITFSLVVPGKNYRPIDNLSGGEKTLASLSLLFALHAAHPSPFFIMDEVDAALDNTNILRVAQFMRKKSREEFQIILISLKEEMYHHVDALVGIYPEPADVCISRNLILDLNLLTERQKR